MVKTIKIIDLLNKIANGEEIPKKIKHWQEIYELKESMFIIYENKYGDCLDLVQCLTDEVEIIEENNRIEKIESDKKEFLHTKNGAWKGRKLDIEFADKINEIIDEINKLKEE